MPALYEHNAVTHQIELMQQQWESEVVGKNYKLVRWLVGNDESPFVDGFWGMEASEYAKLQDLFIMLQTDFTSFEEYGKALIETLKEEFAAQKEDLANDGIYIDWQAVENEKLDSTDYYLTNIQNFAKAIQLKDEQKLVVYHLPQTNQNDEDWTKWWKQLLDKPIDDSLLFMVKDFNYNLLFNEIEHEAISDNMVSLEVSVDMDDLMMKSAAGSNPSDPAAKFRVHMLTAMKAGGDAKFKKMEREFGAAIEIAEEMNFTSQIPCVYLAKAGIYHQHKNYDDALMNYDKTISISTKLEENGDVSSPAILVQASILKATCLLLEDESEAAILTLELAKEITSKHQLHFQHLEVVRQIAMAYEISNLEKEAYEMYLKAINFIKSGQFDGLENYSTIPIIGKATIDLAESLGFQQKKIEIEELMQQLIGKNWDNFKTQITQEDD